MQHTAPRSICQITLMGEESAHSCWLQVQHQAVNMLFNAVEFTGTDLDLQPQVSRGDTLVLALFCFLIKIKKFNYLDKNSWDHTCALFSN